MVVDGAPEKEVDYTSRLGALMSPHQHEFERLGGEEACKDQGRPSALSQAWQGPFRPEVTEENTFRVTSLSQVRLTENPPAPLASERPTEQIVIEDFGGHYNCLT